MQQRLLLIFGFGVMVLYSTEPGPLSQYVHSEHYAHLHIFQLPALDLYPSMSCLVKCFSHAPLNIVIISDYTTSSGIVFQMSTTVCVRVCAHACVWEREKTITLRIPFKTPSHFKSMLSCFSYSYNGEKILINLSMPLTILHTSIKSPLNPLHSREYKTSLINLTP